MAELTDARGVPIAPGDTAIYGFGVSRSVAMAEAVVLGAPPTNDWVCAYEGPDHDTEHPEEDDHTWVRPDGYNPSPVSLTPSGRVRLRVVRRSYSSGEKPIVDVAPDRLVVLKPIPTDVIPGRSMLPPSPLPTQDEEATKRIMAAMAVSVEALRATEAPEWWRNPDRTLALAEYHAFHTKKLAEDRRKLKELP
jgi:hypothetical protein